MANGDETPIFDNDDKLGLFPPKLISPAAKELGYPFLPVWTAPLETPPHHVAWPQSRLCEVRRSVATPSLVPLEGGGCPFVWVVRKRNLCEKVGVRKSRLS